MQKPTTNTALMPETSDDRYEEEWEVIMSTGGKYSLSKKQARLLQQAIASGNRGIILFKTFSISIPFISEFYRKRRFLKGEYQLPATTQEEVYQPIPQEKWERLKKEIKDKLRR